jgi:branched-subunit amino acid ABC-type transport system permease component
MEALLQLVPHLLNGLSLGLLLTFGMPIVIEEVIRLVWGSTEKQMALPEALSGAFLLGDLIYSRCRLFASLFAIGADLGHPRAGGCRSCRAGLSDSSCS